MAQRRGLKNPWAGEEDVFLVHAQNSLNGMILNWCTGGCWFIPAHTACRSLSDRLYRAFHISEGTLFKLSTLVFCIFASFLTFYHFLSLFIKKEAERKITLVFAEGKGLEFEIPTGGQISDPGPRSRRVYFQTLLLYLRRRHKIVCIFLEGYSCQY